MSTNQIIRSFSASSAVPFYLTPTNVLHNPNAYGAGAGDMFGYSVSIGGNYLAIGAYGEDNAGGSASGKAYIFDVQTGSLLHTLNNPSASSLSDGDQFGYSISTSGNIVVVGACLANASGAGSGKVYIFDVQTGSLLHTLNNPNPTGTYFGASVSIYNSKVLVGCSSWDDGATSNTAYIFDAATGSLLHTLDNPNPTSVSGLDCFGQSVAISGNYAVVGAHGEDDSGRSSGYESGKAYIFDVQTGSLLHTLNNPNAYGTSATDYFGFAVSISGNTIIIGAYGEDDGVGTSSGKVYLFDAATGSLLHTLSNPNAYGTSGNDWFGYSVSISGNYAIIGAFYEDDSGGTSAGKAYIFDVQTGSLLHTLNNPNPVGSPSNDWFVWATAISGNRAIIGAYGEDYLGISSGSAYIYQIP